MPKIKKLFKPNILRKLFILLFCAVYIISYPVPVEVQDLGLFFDAQVLFYTNKVPDNLKECDVLSNGINFEIKTNLINAKKIRNSIDVLYQTVIFEGDINYVLKFLKIAEYKTLEFDGGTLITGYCPLIKGKTITNKQAFDDQRINIQIFTKKNKIFIGNPVIFGSY